MQNASVLLTTNNNGVATIELNRPKSLNAINVDMMNSLISTLTEATNNRDIRAVVIQSSGSHFMAGGDIKWFGSLIDKPKEEINATFTDIISKVNEIVLLIKNASQPVIASAQGAVAGFGMSLVSVCDLAIASEDAYFTLAYCHLGTTPDGGATFTLPRTVGLKKAMEIALLGDRISANQALQLGLINQVHKTADLNAEAQKLAQRIAQGPAFALMQTKKLINQSLNSTLEQQLAAEKDSFAKCAQSNDFAEGVTSFLNKRKANFNQN